MPRPCAIGPDRARTWRLAAALALALAGCGGSEPTGPSQAPVDPNAGNRSKSMREFMEKQGKPAKITQSVGPAVPLA